MVKGMLRIASGWWMLVGVTPAGRVVMVLQRKLRRPQSMTLTKTEALDLSKELRNAAESLE